MIQRRVMTPVFEIASRPKVDLTDIEARRIRTPRTCPACGERFHDLLGHISSMVDESHCVLEVMDL
jgi:hypothetical protein